MAAPSDELLPGGFHPFKPVLEKDSGLTTNLARPATDATITVRVIKNFEYRTMKNLVLRDVDLVRTTAGALIALCKDQVRSVPGFKPFRPAADSLDTLKLYSKAHGAKTTNLIINLDHAEYIMADLGKSLADYGLENESEVSLFNRDLYERFLADPETKWL